MRTNPYWYVWVVLLAAGGRAGSAAEGIDFFPAVTQFSPVPAGSGWHGEDGPLSEEILRATVDNLWDHGFRGIMVPTHRPAGEEAVILAHARSKGMIFTWEVGALELFGRTEPPTPCVYSPEYADAVRANAQQALAPLRNLAGVYNALVYQDEPFHWGPNSFGYNAEVQAEFQRRYGYALPPDLESIRGDARKWVDVLNFRSAYFPDGWRQVHRIVQEIAPGLRTTLTHDSHNTFGGGCTSHAELAIDDVFHWGGDFADLFIYDIYPYMMFDFRFGRLGQVAKPRMSQTHYSFAQMRGLTTAYHKDLGFWVGTYHPAWFAEFLSPALEAMHWVESETSMTAVAQGANYLLTGYNVPASAGHWESLGKGLNLLQKAGARLLDTPKVRAKACMLFPRTQYLQLQQEYFNVGLSFELFLRAFGELDMLHEDQVTDDTLLGYDVLVLFDVALLPEAVAQHITAFVHRGGTVIADCVPCRNELREPMAVCEELFGVRDAQTGRLARAGHWVPYVTQSPAWALRPDPAPDESVFQTVRLEGQALGVDLALSLVSPRTCTVVDGEVVATTASGAPALVRKRTGRGQAFLLGFCLQDTYFGAWEENNAAARAQLRALLAAITREAAVRSHVDSSNPDIEAAVRANDRQGFLFVINHEAAEPTTTVRVADLPFRVGEVINLEDGQPVAFTRDDAEAIRLTCSVPVGATLLAELKPAGARDACTLWQLPNQTSTQMMSYVLQSARGKVVVIDGGNAARTLRSPIGSPDGERRPSATWRRYGAHPPLPHRLARWGAQIIGYVGATLRAPSPLPHRLARWGAQIIGYVPPRLSAPPSARPMGSPDHRLRGGNTARTLGSPIGSPDGERRSSATFRCAPAVAASAERGFLGGLGTRPPGVWWDSHVADDRLPPGDKHRARSR
ncbi:MAG: hypothetical protein MUF48_19450 [Pirellulaceae bacterium]|nr:hypothetical protein [Pirellulaceae bacterium]